MKIKLIILFLLLGLQAFLITQKVNFITADLGRHLKNGEQVLAGNFQVLKTNTYSYTHPDYKFLNHHWGSGVIFYALERAFGFKGLSLFFTALSLMTLFLFFDLAQREADFATALMTAVLVLPLLVTRTEIRPEAFSYFLTGAFLWFLTQKKYLFLLPILMLFWVNLHIYFFVVLFLIGVFWLTKPEKKLFIFGFLSLLTCLINPAGIKGLLYPLRIFEGYGYRLFENQSVWFLDKIVSYPPSLYFKITFAFLLISFIYAVFRRSLTTYYLLLATFFSYLAWTGVRNFTLFGLVALPVIAYNFRSLFSEVTAEVKLFLCSTLAVVLFFGLFLLKPDYWREKKDFGLGLKEGTFASASFFKENKLSGPVFNNYDIGGYLIYSLKEPVFVDNRPEAYPAKFFTDVYVPMQENDQKWQGEDKKYNFQTIFFYRHDLTPWGQNFLLSRIKDPSWSPVFVDNWTIIFVKRNEKNKEIITRFELPKEMFVQR